MNDPKIIRHDSPDFDKRFEGTGETKKYEYGRKGRAPIAIVTVHENGVADLENCSTGVFYVARPEGVSDLFAMARDMKASYLKRDRAAGWY